MGSVTQSRSKLVSSTKDAQNTSDLLSSESVLNTLRLILAGAPLADVLTIIAQLVESSGDGALSGSPTRTECSFIVRRHPVFQSLSLAQGR